MSIVSIPKTSHFFFPGDFSSIKLGPTKTAISNRTRKKNPTAGDRSDGTAQEFAQQALDALKAGQAGKDQGKHLGAMISDWEVPWDER